MNSSSLLRFLGCAVLAVVSLPYLALAQDQKISVASVNGDTIYLAEVMAIIEQLPADVRQQPLATYFDRVVDDIIDSRLAASAGDEAGLTNDPEIIEQMSLAAQRVLAEAFVRQTLREAMTDSELQKAYELYVADTSSREEVWARHILVATEAEANEIIAELKAGGDFITLAQERSTGPSGPNGGDLGYFTRGAMVPGFEAAAFSIDVGAFSQTAVQTQFGWHVIKIENRRIAEAPSFEQLQGQLQQNLATQTISRLIERLRADAQITRRSFDEVREATQAAAQN